MADTLIVKILRNRSGGTPLQAGDIAVCDVDLAAIIDIQFSHDRFGEITAVHDPDRVAIVMDHAVPAPSIGDAESGKKARAFAAAHGITKFFDVGRHGIVHQVLAEQGLVQPGMVVACTDSHTCAAGAVGAAARGLGPAEVLQIVCTGRTWYQVPPTVRYELTGAPHEWVNGKDMFLHVAAEYGAATSQCVEFGGPGLGQLPMTDRRTIATQGRRSAPTSRCSPPTTSAWTTYAPRRRMPTCPRWPPIAGPSTRTFVRWTSDASHRWSRCPVR